jgi:hypothetical protein
MPLQITLDLPEIEQLSRLDDASNCPSSIEDGSSVTLRKHESIIEKVLDSMGRMYSRVLGIVVETRRIEK